VLEQSRQQRCVVEDDLVCQLRSGGLEVAGAEASYQALKRNQGDTLVMASDLGIVVSRECKICMYTWVKRKAVEMCPQCGTNDSRDFNLTEELILLGEQQGCSMEIVERSDVLNEVGGIGCLLRFRLYVTANSTGSILS